MNILVVHYNTRILTEACIKSTLRYNPQAHIYVIDNSDREEEFISLSNLPITIIDNTNYRLFDPLLDFESVNHTDNIHSFCIQWFMNNYNIPFILLDSDVIVKKNLDVFVNDKVVSIGRVNYINAESRYRRLEPQCLFINTPMCLKYGVRFFDKDHIFGIGEYDYSIYPDIEYNGATGQYFYEQICEKGLPYAEIKTLYEEYISHFGSGSWRLDNKEFFIGEEGQYIPYYTKVVDFFKSNKHHIYSKSNTHKLSDVKLVQSYNINKLYSNDKSILSNLLMIYITQYYFNYHGVYTDFYADEEFGELIRGLRFNKLDTTLLNNIPQDNKCFAFGKMLVLKNTPINTIHFDTDIMIKDIPYVIDKLSKEFDACFWDVEKKTPGCKYNGDYFFLYKSLQKHDNVIGYTDDLIYNCGFLGFRNKELKDKFLTTYFNRVNIINDHYKEISDDVYKLKHYRFSVIPDLINEQLNISNIIRYNNYNVITIHEYPYYCTDDYFRSNNDKWKDIVDKYNTNYTIEDNIHEMVHYFGDIKSNDVLIRDLYEGLKGLDDTFYYDLFLSNIKKHKELYTLLTHIVNDADILDIRYPEIQVSSEVLIISTDKESKLIIQQDNTNTIYISDDIDSKEDIIVSYVNSSVLSKIYDHFRCYYKWIIFTNKDTVSDLEVIINYLYSLDTTNISNIDIISRNYSLLINTSISYQELLSSSLSDFNILHLK